jgi:D-alanyl-D-alanine carboxypeptidase/D-alanyl-D-alanine-endopeptidase (penicillin-binding protein 4)
MPRRPLVLLLALCALLAAAPAAHAISQPALQAKLALEMRRAGPLAGAYVRDLTTGRVLYARSQDVARMPASVEKLYTTSTVLLRMGPDETLRTSVLGAGSLGPDGTWHGDLYLHGGGDPTLGSPGIDALARSLADQAGVARVDGSVLGDESLFDPLRGSARTGFAFDRDVGGLLGALTVGRGFAPDGRPAAAAARRLAHALRDDGVRVAGRTGTGAAPAQAPELAGLASPPVRELIRLTNAPSDNYLAETLLKELGARFGGAGTTVAGAAVVRAQLAGLGLHPRLVDGSGLARADRTTPRQVVRLLELMHVHPLGPVFEDSLAVAGRTGTLDRRLRGSPAQDRCRAKTGTLVDVSTLAGLCQAAGGHVVAFAILMQTRATTRAHRLQDHMATAIARFDGP